MTTGVPPSRPRSSRPTCPGAVAAGQPGRSANGIATGVVEVVGQPAEPRPEDDPDAQARGPTARGPRLRGRPGGPAARRAGSGRRDRRSRHERAGLRERVQGEDGRGPLRKGPDGRTDTGMPVAVRRAVVDRTGTNEAAGSGQRSARSDRRGAEALDVISVSPVPDGPFGQDLRYGPAGRRVNGVVHELALRTPASIHEFCTDCGRRVDKPGLEEVAAAVSRPSRTSRSAAAPRGRLGPLARSSGRRGPARSRRSAASRAARAPRSPAQGRVAQDRPQVVAVRGEQARVEIGPRPRSGPGCSRRRTAA